MAQESGAQAVQLRLDGFAGPLDLLLDLARRQRVDLSRICIVTLVDQYLDAVTGADRGNLIQPDLIQAADWLVMAAWLTWLKSRLLLPVDLEQTRQAEQSRQALTRHLTQLARVRETADWLQGRTQLGWDSFERGYREPAEAAIPATTVVMLMEACLDVFRRAGLRPAAPYQPRRIPQWTPQQASLRLLAMLAEHPGGGELLGCVPALPPGLPDREARLRGAIAGTLIAGLELAREGRVQLHQDAAFAPVTIRPGAPPLDPVTRKRASHDGA